MASSRGTYTPESAATAKPVVSVGGKGIIDPLDPLFSANGPIVGTGYVPPEISAGDKQSTTDTANFLKDYGPYLVGGLAVFFLLKR